jgi:hypothetical protein
MEVGGFVLTQAVRTDLCLVYSIYNRDGLHEVGRFAKHSRELRSLTVLRMLFAAGRGPRICVRSDDSRQVRDRSSTS